jgi:hypothetical protein
MDDTEFLNWIYERLVRVHGETPNRDYMHRFRRLIDGKTDAQSKLRDEILAVMWRYSQESDVTILETIKAANQAAERIAQIALDNRG